jgi:hypothetical protein
MDSITKDNGFRHGYKKITIRNKHTGKVESIRSKHNYFIKNKKKEERKIKEKWSGGDYDVISVNLL